MSSKIFGYNVDYIKSSYVIAAFLVIDQIHFYFCYQKVYSFGEIFNCFFINYVLISWKIISK